VLSGSQLSQVSPGAQKPASNTGPSSKSASSIPHSHDIDEESEPLYLQEAEMLVSIAGSPGLFLSLTNMLA
jgi:hypothetical protein